MSYIKTVNFNGMKIRIEDLPKEAWTHIQGAKDRDDDLISIVRKCLNYRKNTISDIPWKVVNMDDKTLFNSDESIPFAYRYLKPLINSIPKIETNLLYGSRAYYYITDQRVLDYNTITNQWDSEYGIVGYERKIKDRKLEIPVEEMIYLWEQGVSETEPIESVIDSIEIDVKLIRSVDMYVSQYFDNGTIKATILTTKEQSYPVKDEVDKVESFLNRQVKGLKNAFKSIFLRIPITATTVGSGLEDFDPKLIDAKVLSIIIAFEVPASAVLPSAANYATAISDKRLFYESVGIPRINFIFNEFNEQYLENLGLKIVAEPEKLSVFQEDESLRSGSLKNLIDSGFELIDATEILGYKLSEEAQKRLQEKADMMSNPPLPSSFVFGDPNGQPNQQNNQQTDTQANAQNVKTYIIR